MNSPRLEVDLRKLRHNTRTLVERLAVGGIRVTAVTKAVCGHPAIARAMLDGGAVGLAESRLSNAKRLRKAGMDCPITMIRTPMLSQVDDVVKTCAASFNTQTAVISALAAAALRQNKVHGILLMVKMGDLREGIRPDDLGDIAQKVSDMPGVALTGIGANFACMQSIAPTAAKMRALSAMANDVEARCGPSLRTVSGGNSANLHWALGPHATGRINDLRIGEAILLGVDPITGEPIAGLHQDAFTLVAEVIETDAKPMRLLTGKVDHTLVRIRPVPEASDVTRIILALGNQDTDAASLLMPSGCSHIGATSDHLVIGTKDPALCVGAEMRLGMTYSALMRVMVAPDIQIELYNDRPEPTVRNTDGPAKHLALV